MVDKFDPFKAKVDPELAKYLEYGWVYRVMNLNRNTGEITLRVVSTKEIGEILDKTPVAIS